MFDLDKWQEIFATMRRNKLRTFLTGFSVAWGIFILIILLGCGKGLEHGVTSMFEGDAINSIWISGGETSKPYKGYKAKRPVRLSNPDYLNTRENVSGLSGLSTRTRVIKTTGLVYHNRSFMNYDIQACMPDMQEGEGVKLLSGRFINSTDMRENRKVVVIGKPVGEDVFGAKDPIGNFVFINGASFLVVGVFTDDGGPWDNKRMYIPISTSQRIFSGNKNFDQMIATTVETDGAGSKKMETRIRQLLARQHEFSSDDEYAVWANNNMENYSNIMSVIFGIRLFVWIIGLGTIIAGIVGVSNIMMISVKERTREIGIRKSVGATPASVVGMVLQESVMLTFVAGYLGLFLGILTLESMKTYLPASDFFKNPEVDIRLAVYALLLIVMAGTLAGFFPAWRAAAIKPIEALKEN
jgi:putative ABC transport system permease protein